MYVKSEIFEDIVCALRTRSFLSLCIFEEKLDACLEFWIEPSQLAVHHLDYLVVVLQSQENVLEACQKASEGTDLYLFHLDLKLALLKLGFPLFQDVYPCKK